MCIRYPYDVYDRAWNPFNSDELTALTTKLTADKNTYDQPDIVIQTSAVPKNNLTGAIEFYMEAPDEIMRYYMYAHFMEVQVLQPDEFRAMNIKVNGELFYGPVVPSYLSSNTIYSIAGMTGKTNYSFSIERYENSTLPPILNAFEIYSELDFSQSETDDGDGKLLISN